MGLFSRFVTAIRCARSGLCPRSSLLGEDEIASPSDLADTNLVITNEGAFLQRSLTDEARNMIATDGNLGVISATPSASHLFHCTLWPQKTNSITWDLYRFGGNGIHLEANLHWDGFFAHMIPVQKNRIWASLGLVVATCVGQPEALPASPQTAFTTDLMVEGLSDGMAGLREAEELIGPLRPLADSVVIDRHVNFAAVVNNRRLQSRPFGALVVRVC